MTPAKFLAATLLAAVVLGVTAAVLHMRGPTGAPPETFERVSVEPLRGTTIQLTR